MAEFQFADVPNAFEAGRQIGRQRQQENALMQAQKKFGAGDYKGASNDLFQYAPELAMKTANYGQQQQQQQARMQAGTMAASGDLKGAASTLAGQGDLEGWKSLDDIQTQKLSGMYDFGARVLYGLQGLPVEQRKAAALAAARNSPYADILVPQTEQENDWSDGRLQAGIAGAISVQDQLKQKTEAAKLDQGERRLDILERGVIAKENAGNGLGKPPKDYRWKADGSGEVEPIPGGPAATKVADAKRKADSLVQGIKTASGNVLNAISQAEKLTSGGTTGLIGDITKGIGGTKSHDLQSAINTIVANIGFDRLTEMRQSSPTGGALGAVSERELSLLQSVVASLEQSQSEAQFRDNLRRVKTQYQRTLQALDAAYQEDYGDAGAGAAGAGDADLIYVPGQGLVPAR